MAMKKLSVELRSILSSSLQIKNFKRVVEELVYNSLDAKATSIAIRIDIAENKIQVVDNGCGITENDFDLIGQKYSTSKFVDLKTLKSVPNTYGFRGQFLANLINIAQKVKITSRFDKGEDTWVKIFFDGKERDLARTTTRPSVGTTVEVSGLFYNLHIQSKNVESLNELNEIKTLLKQLSLIHSNISISLRDDSKNEIVFKAHKNRNVYQTFGMLFNIDEKDIQEFKVEKREYKVTAYFAKKDKDIGQYQWIYLNGKFINNCKLHKIVNDALSKSLKPFLKRKVKTKVDDNEDVFPKRNLPFYVILLSCPYYDYDISDSSKHTTIEFKNWQAITNLLKKLILFYTGKEINNKQIKCEETAINYLKPKVSDDDMKIQVRKIVEKLLKSNSKKLGVSQMQNGVKGKLMKRKKTKKENSLKLSLSKVIPSKNKLIRQLPKHISKKSESNDVVLPISKPKITSTEKLRNDNVQIVNDRRKHQTVPTHSPDIEEIYKRKRIQGKCKYKNAILNDSDRSTDMSISKKKNSVDRKSKIMQYNYELHTICKDKHKEDKIIKSKFTDSIDIEILKNKYDIEVNRDFTRNNRAEAEIYNSFYEKEHLMNENNITTICNFTNSNTKIHEKVEEIIVYDYIPHPLNSNQCHDLNENRLKKKSTVSSRDLVKTILSTQQNISTPRLVALSGEDNYKPQRLGILPNRKDILTTSTKEKRENVAKDIRGSTFDAWNFNFRPNLNLTNALGTESERLSKITYESHHYNKNMCNHESQNTGIKRTKQFITKKSKDNFLISIEKQKNNLYKNLPHKSKYLNKPKVTKNHDVNFTLGINNFFKTNNFMPGSSITIEFSNSTEKNILRKTKYQDNFIHMNFNKSLLNSRTNKEPFDKNSASFYNKNTYSIAETSLDAKYDCNILGQNYECIRYTNNLMHGTYTIETNNEECPYNCINNKDAEIIEDKMLDIEDKMLEKQNGLNIVFVSEPQMAEADPADPSADKIIEPINICETVFSDSHHSKKNASFGSLTHMENVVDEINNHIVELADKQKTLSPKIALQEFSHHFNTTINNTNDIANDIAVANKSPISNLDFHAQNNLTNNIIMINNTTITSNFENKAIILRETNYLTNQNLPNGGLVNTYSIKNRPRFMPKGMSQIFESCNTKGFCDFNLNEEYFECNIYKNFTNNVQMNTEIFKPGIQNATEDTTKAIEKVHTKLHKDNSSLIFNGELLKQAQVLGQVDDKFIAAIVKAKSETSDFLVLFDQHAVHERIRLEKNMADYFNQHEWMKVKLDDFLLKLSKDEILYLHNYKEKFAQLGLEWNILSDCEASVFGIPKAILGKNPRQADKVIAAVKNLVLEGISTIKFQGGCISLHPKSIMDLVFSEACRYAIKFGDKLNITECRELIQSLSECKTPFQCAHGRPVMAVLMEMSTHYERDYKIDMSKVRLFSVRKPMQELNDQK